jgi:hypothetical protein
MTPPQAGRGLARAVLTQYGGLPPVWDGLPFFPLDFRTALSKHPN